jgi:excisionase family DNA binding protein
VVRNSERASIILPEHLLTVADLAVALKVSKATVYAMVGRNELPHLRISNAIRFEASVVSEIVARSRRGIRANVRA